MIGLKRGTVELHEHDATWKIEADYTIMQLEQLLGNVIKNIQHVGSTSIPTIKAKPIIDIALAVDDFNDIIIRAQMLAENGFYYRPNVDIKNELLIACGNYYEGAGDIQTHFIHVVLTDSMEWKNYINFRDYLNKNIDIAKQYENLKVSLALNNPIDSGREKYLNGKR
ncbi:MAG: GrpB family protein, partial [Clostridia bacterium]|nr:GrpB family protein [Clostridia bacterium]